MLAALALWLMYLAVDRQKIKIVPYSLLYQRHTL
jgi:hypothetical protein